MIRSRTTGLRPSPWGGGSELPGARGARRGSNGKTESTASASSSGRTNGSGRRKLEIWRPIVPRATSEPFENRRTRVGPRPGPRDAFRPLRRPPCEFQSVSFRCVRTADRRFRLSALFGLLCSGKRNRNSKQAHLYRSELQNKCPACTYASDTPGCAITADSVWRCVTVVRAAPKT